MDTIGSLELAWVQGFDGSNAPFVDRNVLCFKCGNSVKFVGEDGYENVLPSPSEGVGPLAVHPYSKTVAFTDLCLQPSIYVYQYPTFRLVSQLTDGAQLEYTCLTFSNSNYLASLSGLPEFQLTVWNYTDGFKLCVANLSHFIPTSVSFNPANWRQICVTTQRDLTLWTIEQCDTLYSIQSKKLKLPPEDQIGSSDFEEKEREMPTRASTRMTKMTVDLPKNSLAGVSGEQAEKFEQYMDIRVRVVPVSHAWSTKGDLFVGCEAGQLLKIDSESMKVKVIHNPNVAARAFSSRISAYQDEKEADEQESGEKLVRESTSGLFGTSPLEGSLSCLALHKKGLFAGGEDGTLRLLECGQDDIKVIDSYPLGVPITSLNFNQTFTKLGISSSRGSITIIDPSNPSEMKTFLDLHYGNFIGVDAFSSGSEYIATAREDGEVQVWSCNHANVVSSCPLGLQATSLACSPLCHVVAVGTSSGHMCIVDFTNFADPRVIHRIHLHNGPVKQIAFDPYGQVLVTGSNDGHLFIIHGKPSLNFQVIGHTVAEGDVQGISTYCKDKGDTVHIGVSVNPTPSKRMGASKLITMDITLHLLQDQSGCFSNLKREFSNQAINKMTLNFTTPSNGIAVLGTNTAFTLAQNTKQLHKLQTPDEAPKKAMGKDSYLWPLGEFIGHQLPGGFLKLSPHHKWIASGGLDGKLTVRTIDDLDHIVEVNPHDFRTGGIQCFTFTADGQSIITGGYDGTIARYKWNFSDSGAGKGKAAIETAKMKTTSLLRDQQNENEVVKKMSEWTPSSGVSRPDSSVTREDKELLAKEQALENDQIYTTPTPTPAGDATWLEITEIEAVKEEDKEYADLKRGLRTEIRDMRRTIQSMMKENEVVQDIEKLDKHEFDLDIDEQTRLHAEGEAEVQKIREDKEFENLATMYIREVIKRECWDNMEVKGRGIQSFTGNLMVQNYPMRKRSDKDLEKLDLVIKQRQIEMAELTHDDDFNESEDAEGEGKDHPSTSGSLGVRYGGHSEYFYSQFELHTREQKINQIILLEDAIHRIKVAFDKEFDDVYKKKGQEIARIKDKNRRIQKILRDLDLPEEPWEPAMGVIEKPESLLVVEDHEVKVEKFLTPEQRKIVEAEKKAEEERRLREKGDNARERALDQMMGGVLEVKKEDELKKDIPVPAFMLSKSEETWTEDEKKMVLEYEKKVKELTEEREKYRKQLETELKKLQGLIQDGSTAFDEILKELFIRKIKTEMVILQEELKITRLKYSLLLEEELNSREKELNGLLTHKHELKHIAGIAYTESKKSVDAFRELYDILTAEDKVMDKAFKREFHDCTALQVDQLYKLFRRRPRGQKGGQLRGGASVGELPTYDPNSGNPFIDRPSTAQQSDSSKRVLDVAMNDLDKPTNSPDGLDFHVWERMCKYRRQKIESEQLVKQKALVFAEMQAFMQRRQEEDEQLKNEIEDLTQASNKLKDDHMRFTCNIEVQLLLKQGQVEVDSGPFIHDYLDSILLHRSVVEDLNHKIRALGESKISSMEESKDFRKGIIQLEWEHKKMIMEMEDLQNKMRDIQNLKVTREIQAYLYEDDYDAKKAQEITTLEQTLIMQKQHHEKNVDDRKKIIKELKKNIRDRSGHNNGMENELTDLNVSVNERRHIHEVNADKSTDIGAGKRYQEIVQRRKLVDLAKAQAQEVAILRAEVERLRMRTFPALVQVEH